MTKEIRCEKCGVYNPEYMEYCQFCKAPLKTMDYKEEGTETKNLTSPKPTSDKPQPGKIVCPYCGNTNPEKVDFCYKCGKKLKKTKEPLTRKETMSRSISGTILVLALVVVIISMLKGIT